MIVNEQDVEGTDCKQSPAMLTFSLLRLPWYRFVCSSLGPCAQAYSRKFPVLITKISCLFLSMHLCLSRHAHVTV